LSHTNRAAQEFEEGANMLVRTTFTVALLLSNSSATAAGPDSKDRELWDWLLLQARDIDFDQCSSHRAIYALLTIARGCRAMEQHQLADEYFHRAQAVDVKDQKVNHHSTLFNYAMDTGQIALAGKIAEESRSDSLLNSWDVERFRRGDHDAIKGYPRGKMTFYAAWGLANVFVELGDYERAEELVGGIESTVGNSPEEVAGLIFKAIAIEYREKGELEKAKRYIDKALAIAHGRGTGYVGYAVEIAHRSIHGRLTKDLDEFAQKGAYFPAHMGRELVQNLAGELVRTGHDDEAKRSVALLRKPEDVADSMRSISNAQARRGDTAAALKTVEEIEDVQTRDAARIGIANVLCKNGQSETAKELADVVVRRWTEEKGSDSTLGQSLAALYARLHCQPELEQVIAQARAPESKTDRILRAIRGFAGSMAD